MDPCSKQSFFKINSGLTKFASRATCVALKLIIRLPQPVHLIVLITVIYLGFVLMPSTKDELQPLEPYALTSLIYVGCFATHFGAQMWMTFVSGIVLFFTIPRHIFGHVQRQLFPKYFLLNTILSFATLATFLRHYPTNSWTCSQKVQACVLSLCFLIELSTRIYIVPPLIETLTTRMEIEQEAGVGHEVGRHEPGQLRNCPRYMSLHKKFRKLHGVCAVANMATVACSGIHLYHLATKLCTTL